MNNNDAHDLSQEAIKAAITQNWKDAITLNEKILVLTPNDIPSLNRLGIALSVTGHKTKAVKAFRAVTTIDPHNQIAINNLKRLQSAKNGAFMNPTMQHISFIEEPGRSKVIPLTSLGEPKVFSTLSIGQMVELIPCKHKIKIITTDKEHLGYLPDNISVRLIKLLAGGYKYKAVLKSVNPKTPQVFIQETHTSKKLKGATSFPLDENDNLPTLSGGESSETPPLEIYDPLISSEE